jgi:hypothetical protein
MINNTYLAQVIIKNIPVPVRKFCENAAYVIIAD